MEILDSDTTVPTTPPPLQVGESVRYVPARYNANKLDGDHEYPWAIGRRSRDGKGVDELTGRDLVVFLAGMRRRAAHLARNVTLGPEGNAHTAALAKQILLLRPNKTWAARVREVYQDGSALLDIQNQTIWEDDPTKVCVTLHHRVPHDPTKSSENSFHRETT